MSMVPVPLPTTCALRGLFKLYANRAHAETKLDCNKVKLRLHGLAVRASCLRQVQHGELI